MQVKVYKSLWGMAGPLEEQFEHIRSAGYDGVECAVQDVADPEKFGTLLRDFGLAYIALVYTEEADHAEALRRRVEFALKFQPQKIVAHSGRDTMSFGKTIRFFEHALRVEEELNIPIAHETHRRRPLYSPMNTLVLLRELPDLCINADFSHWCVVTESMLEDHQEALTAAARHAIHIHGRVGFENGPQVPDPRVEEWADRVAKHEKWWDLIIAAHVARKEPVLTFVPEYGPPTYMPTVPATGQPVADLWEVCLWAANRFREQFQSRTK